MAMGVVAGIALRGYKPSELLRCPHFRKPQYIQIETKKVITQKFTHVPNHFLC